MHSRPSLFFFFNDTATTEIYTLSLHDALPILDVDGLGALVALLLLVGHASALRERAIAVADDAGVVDEEVSAALDRKSTRPELQSRQYLVCRLLLEKKKKTNNAIAVILRSMHF